MIRLSKKNEGSYNSQSVGQDLNVGHQERKFMWGGWGATTPKKLLFVIR